MPNAPITSSESRIRLTAFFVLVLIVVYMITDIGLIPVFLLLDFTVRGFSFRGFGLGAYSPLGWIAGRIATTLRLSAKPVYMPPKRFAARIGFLFCLAIVVAHYAHLSTLVLSCILALFAALESLAGFCAGCYVYNAYARLRRQ